MLTTPTDLNFVLKRLRSNFKRSNLKNYLEQISPNQCFTGQVHQVEHHLAHLSSSFYVSPFKEAVVVSIDGFGDFASAAWGVGRSTNIVVKGKVFFPHSLGIFYQALTQYIGFPNYGDEYKMMGLAPYGQPVYLPEMRKIVLLQIDGSFKLNLDYFRHHNGKADYVWETGTPSVASLFSQKLIDLMGPARQKDEPLTQHHKNIARSVQDMYEEALFLLLKNLHNKYKLDSLALAGGCGMNSVANGKILLNTPFKHLYVQSAAGDAGGAIGAAYSVWHELGGVRSPVHDHAYWGTQFSNEEIGRILKLKLDVTTHQFCNFQRIDDSETLCFQTAEAIARGEVVGWFQGRMEWGPRALGNRSILGDPRRADMKETLNLKIKRRESFRPFAPSVLQNCVSDWFEQDDDVPFMMQVYQIREDKRKQIPAVTHIDGSGRLQTVYAHTNPLYHSLITAFYSKTGVPMVLNTSFNENEPVVSSPGEALDCFLRTKMDMLVIGNWVVKRKGSQ
jgi:carbamoyltransferase